MMVVRSGSTVCNDKIEKRSTSLGEMTFYWVMNRHNEDGDNL